MTGMGLLADIGNINQSPQLCRDKDVHERKVERIFSRAWLFLGHESLLPKPGDFIITYKAEDFMAEDKPQHAAKAIASRSADANWGLMLGSPTTRTSTSLL